MDLSKASETVLEQNSLSLSNKVPDQGTFLEDSLQEQAILTTCAQYQQVPALIT